MRITVSLIVNLVAKGMSIAEILNAYSYLAPEDIRQTWSTDAGAWHPPASHP